LEVFVNSRFITNIALALIGGFLVVVSQVWAPSIFMWLMLAGGIAAVALAGAALTPGRGQAQRSLDGALALLGAWTIIASLVFGGTLMTWLGFASGIAFVAIALIGRSLHELHTERVVHSFAVRDVSTSRDHTPAQEYAAVN
jgi:hypothetical protein